jgi:hypothetical protein
MEDYMPAPITYDGDLDKALNRFFEEHMQEAVVEFPQLKGKFAAINARTRKFAVKPPRMGPFLRYSLKKNARQTYRAIEEANKHYIPKKDLAVITYMQRMCLSMSIEADMRLTLDHELAHCLIDKEGRKGVHFDEVAADVFAMLRHYQYYGTKENYMAKEEYYARQGYEKDDYMGRLKGVRERYLVYGDIEHFSKPALEALEAMKGDIDFENMTPQEQIDLATSIADDHCLPEETFNDIVNIFNAAAEKNPKTEEAFNEALAEVVCDSAGENKAAAGFMAAPLVAAIRNNKQMDRTKRNSLVKKLNSLF